MNYDLVLHPRAQRELDRVPADRFRHLDAALSALRDNPRPQGIKKLNDQLYRIRVGEWRVIFAIVDHAHRVVILRVARRSERTYKGLPHLR